MDATGWLTDMLTVLAGQPLPLMLVIIAATFVLEDLATVTVALLAGQMVIPGEIALAAVLAGTVLGDLALYAAARWAGRIGIVRRWTERPAAAAVLGWMRRHAIVMTVVARFTPGLRLPVFAGAGTIGVPFLPFALAILISALVWTPGLWLATISLGGSDPDFGLTAAAAGAVLLLAPRATARLLARAGAGR